jgi:hypothetical protein
MRTAKGVGEQRRMRSYIRGLDHVCIAAFNVDCGEELDSAVLLQLSEGKPGICTFNVGKLVSLAEGKLAAYKVFDIRLRQSAEPVVGDFVFLVRNLDNMEFDQNQLVEDFVLEVLAYVVRGRVDAVTC